MGKYVCDFDKVNSIGEKICSVAEEMEKSITNYDSQIKDDLSSWDGSAKSSFQNACDNQVLAAKSTSANMNEVGEFIKSAAEAINSLETELSSIEI